MNQPNKNTHISTVAHLRGLMPTMQIQPWEAKRIAETQAYRLRTLLGDSTPHFDTNELSNLPRVDVTLQPELAASGSTQWHNGAWRIRINSADALVRQRFTLAHEFKHLLDAPLIDSTYALLAERIDGDQQIEWICNYFAACLLMPKRWVKRLWGEGVNQLDALADAFDVSTIAMKRRLEDIGLIDRPCRIHRMHTIPDRRVDSDWFNTPRIETQQKFRRSPPKPIVKEFA